MQTPSLCLASFHYLRTVWQLKVSKTHAWSLRRMASLPLRTERQTWRSRVENLWGKLWFPLPISVDRSEALSLRKWNGKNATFPFSSAHKWSFFNSVQLIVTLRQLYKLNYLVLCIQNLLRHNGPRDFLCFSSKLSTPRNTVLMISVASNQMTDCMLIGMTFKVESVSN